MFDQIDTLIKKKQIGDTFRQKWDMEVFYSNLIQRLRKFTIKKASELQRYSGMWVLCIGVLVPLSLPNGAWKDVSFYR